MPRSHRNPILLPILLCAGLTVAPAASPVEVPPEESPWLGVDGEPLPFTDEEAILDFLAHATVIESRRTAGGTNRPFKLTLERDGVRAHAVFRTVDRNREAGSRLRPRLRETRPRDSYVFEVAAYEIARLLGLRRVPPVVLRTIDGRTGSLQLWMERTRTKASRIETDETPTHPASWHLQHQLMTSFDLLIHNADRNPGNVLVDDDGRLWFIDHTRAFQQVPSVISSIEVCERSFYERLRSLDPKLLRRRLRPYLTVAEIGALSRRRQQLLEHLERLIAERGEGAVLFELEV